MTVHCEEQRQHRQRGKQQQQLQRTLMARKKYVHRHRQIWGAGEAGSRDEWMRERVTDKTAEAAAAALAVTEEACAVRAQPNRPRLSQRSATERGAPGDSTCECCQLEEQMPEHRKRSAEGWFRESATMQACGTLRSLSREERGRARSGEDSSSCQCCDEENELAASSWEV
jgi:hypothetical protein